MNTAEAVQLFSLLEQIAERTPSDALHAGIAVVMQHIRPCIPLDQLDPFDRYCARKDYLDFLHRMESCAESMEDGVAS